MEAYIPNNQGEYHTLTSYRRKATDHDRTNLVVPTLATYPS